MPGLPVGAIRREQRVVTRTARGETTRRHILDTAARPFAEKGYTATTVNDLITAAGVTKGAFYFHFDAKQTLAVTLVHAKHARWTEVMRAAAASEGTTIDTAIRVMHEVAELFQSDPAVRAAIRLSHELGERAVGLPKPYAEWVTFFEGLLARGERDGSLRADLDVPRTAGVLVAGFVGAEAVSRTTTGLKDLHERVDDFWAAVLPSLRDRPVAVPTR